eukprot:CAMPEP_0115333436 /NCGR_PEP_ID=MMETSP0270-20121206/87375_1 /TAXON_ID=71861 /ORGANISM="Scrippsiella trochoidea, Strain CCMP3099" /LENGTH=305 /DNA_ID=CAMNT_0002754349 /DNA_START=103 /DNA_END=1020 /DNA_ORIENTATION=-
MMQLFDLKCCLGSESNETMQMHDDTMELTVSFRIRTARGQPVSAEEALVMLAEGNARYVGGRPLRVTNPVVLRTALAEQGQNPLAVVVGCADSCCPIETAFDAQAGDIFVLRNAGNSCPCGDGSIVGSVEYAAGALGTRLLVVMGHTKCGAMVSASKLVVGPDTPPETSAQCRSVLEQYLSDLTPAAKEAASQLDASASVEEVAAEAIRINVFRTIRLLLECSATLREKVRNGGFEMHGAIYDIETGEIKFLGQHPSLEMLLNLDKFLGQHPSLETLLNLDIDIPHKESAESLGAASTSTGSSPK